MYSYGPSHMAVQKQDDQLELTYSDYVRTQDVTLKTCRRRWVIGRSGERGSGISVLAARHDDDDDECSIFYSGLCIEDLFTFSSMIHQFLPWVDSKIMVSFYITSLFINVPLDEVISIRADFLYEGPLISVPSFPESVFVELMELATKSVSFCFNNTMHHQVDCISMGSPLGPIIANMFFGFYEKLLFDRFPKPYISLRYVGDTFACFYSRNEALSFFQRLND